MHKHCVPQRPWRVAAEIWRKIGKAPYHLGPPLGDRVCISRFYSVTSVVYDHAISFGGHI